MIKTIQTNKIAAVLLAVMITFALSFPAVINAVKPEDVAARVAERKAEAEVKLKERREKSGTKSAEARQAACEKRLVKINDTMDKLSDKVAKHVGVFSSIHSRVQGFYDSDQLTVSNYDELNAAAEVAKLAAEVEAEALGELNVEIDCTDPEVSLSVSAFRDSASVARDALKAYRKALVDLISAMKSANSSQNRDAATSEPSATITEDDESDPTTPIGEPINTDTPPATDDSAADEVVTPPSEQ